MSNNRNSIVLRFWVLAAILLDSINGQNLTCEFSIVEGEATFVDDTYVGETETRHIQFDVSELTQVGALLYRAIGYDPVISGEVQESISSALQFVTYKTNQSDNSISVFVSESMEGIADYDNTADQVDAWEQLTLEFKMTFDQYICTLQFTHHTKDENTNAPHFNFSLYNISIREDYPLHLNLPDVEILAVDYDAEAPNNLFNVATDSLCPIEPSTPIHITEKGVPELIEFVLHQPLDYDRDPTNRLYECITTLKDFGEPPLSSSSTLMVNVIGYPDESPEFSSEYYSGILESTLENSAVLTRPKVEATDLDYNGTDAVKYSMADANPNVEGSEYFEIDPVTAQITLCQTIPSSFLSNEHVEFILYATDDYNHTGVSFLSCELPGLPQNETYIYFDNYMYASQVISPEQNDVVLQVHAITSSEEAVTYSLVNSSIFFEINSSNGVIWCTQPYTPPDDYYFGVDAKVQYLEAQSLVNIYVEDRLEGETPIITDSISNVTIWENYTGIITSLEAEGNCEFCLLFVDPEKYFEYFKVNPLNGNVFLVMSLEEDEVRDVTLKVACITEGCSTIGVIQQRVELQRNEAIIFIKVNDLNDNAPSFGTFRDVVVAYPVNEALQRVDGVVLKAQATDVDSSDELAYAIEDPSDTFAIDSASGNVFLKGDFGCDSEEGCKVGVTAYDSEQLHQDSTNITILGLPMAFISTILLEDEDPSAIEETLNAISIDIGIHIHQVYSAFYEEDEVSEMQLVFDILVHAYALDKMELLSTSELNVFLLSNGYDEAKVFTEMDYFRSYTIIIEGGQSETNEEREESLEIAVWVLAGILALILIGIFIFGIVWWKRKLKAEAPIKISTIQGEYQDSKKSEAFSSIFGTRSLKPEDELARTLVETPLSNGSTRREMTVTEEERAGKSYENEVSFNGVDIPAENINIRNSESVEVDARAVYESENPEDGFDLQGVMFASSNGANSEATNEVPKPSEDDLENAERFTEVSHESMASGPPISSNYDDIDNDESTSSDVDKFPEPSEDDLETHFHLSERLTEDSHVQNDIIASSPSLGSITDEADHEIVSDGNISSDGDKAYSDNKGKSVDFKIMVDVRKYEEDLPNDEEPLDEASIAATYL